MAVPLVVDDNKLRTLREYAESHYVNVSEMKRLVSGDAAPMGERPGHECMLDFGYRVVFSVEEHPQRDGSTQWLRHMSMSLNVPGRVPNEYALALVGEQLGFPTQDNLLEQGKVQMWMEGEAINVVCEAEKPDGS